MSRFVSFSVEKKLEIHSLAVIVCKEKSFIMSYTLIHQIKTYSVRMELLARTVPIKNWCKKHHYN